MHTIRPSRGSRTKTRRLGRGNASSRGTYSGKGQKGQRARTGGRGGLKLMGIRNMLQGIPKRRGFTSLYKKPAVVNLGDLRVFPADTVITPKALAKQGMVRDIRFGVKILGTGELKHGLRFEGCEISAPAREKIEKAGGGITAPVAAGKKKVNVS